MIASKQCSSQIIIDSDVLRHLLTRSATSYYLEKDTANLHELILLKDSIIVSKDAMIENRNLKIETIESIGEIKDLEIKSLEKQNKSITKRASLFKITTYLVGVLGSITTVLALLH